MKFSLFRARRRRHAFRFVVVLLVISMTLVVLNDTPTGAETSLGQLDPNFGTGGKVMTGWPGAGNPNAWANAVALQRDGKIVVAGDAFLWSSSGNHQDFAIARYDRDGVLDPTFGSEGLLTTALLGRDEAFAVAIQSDGKIVVGGYAGYMGSEDPEFFALVRYNSDGTRDKSFGSNGKVMTQLSSFYDEVQALAIQPDGKILAAGLSSDRDFALARYNTDGTLDSTFGAGGKVLTEFPLYYASSAHGVGLRQDGHIVVAGYVAEGTIADFALACYNPDGSLDTRFGKGGRVTADLFGKNEYGVSLAIQQDGNLIVAGNVGVWNAQNQFALARYTEDGLLDPNFGQSGRVAVDFSPDTSSLKSLAVQPDGKVVMAGSVNKGARGQDFLDFVVVRLNADGSQDLTFGMNGKVTTDFADDMDVATAVCVVPDGRILAVGYSNQTYPRASQPGFALACYIGDATPPQITGAEVIGKKLYVYGTDFDYGAKIYLAGEKQKTANGEEDMTTMLVGKKAGKKIGHVESVLLQVQNPNGVVSNEFQFTRP